MSIDVERWRVETGVVPDDEHCVYLTNEAGDTLILHADHVALFVNDLIASGDAFVLDGELRYRPIGVGGEPERPQELMSGKSGTPKHAAWCYLPKDHPGQCEGDQ